MMMNELIEKGYKLKHKIKDLQAESAKIDAEILKIAKFKPGSKTGRAIGDDVTAKVQIRENIKYDQNALQQINNDYAMHLFFSKAFKTEFKPRSSKDLDNVMAINEDFREAVLASRTIKPGKPYVTFEKNKE